MEFKATCIHSLLTLRNRMGNLNTFKAENYNILVATDIASRGLDIPTVDLVINFDVPVEPIDYVHRTGRTARAGRGGTAVTMITQFDIKLIYSIEEYIGVTLEQLSEELVSTEDQVLEDMTYSSKVISQIKLSQNDFYEKLENYKLQKHNFKNKIAKNKRKNNNKLNKRKRNTQEKHKNDKNKDKYKSKMQKVSE